MSILPAISILLNSFGISENAERFGAFNDVMMPVIMSTLKKV